MPLDPFLAQLGTQAMNWVGQYLSGGLKGRPQWRDLEFMNDAQNRLWPDEIKRQGQFLEGLAPSQATAHNTYEDQTFLADVERRTQGIKQMGSQLGMSPWELTGQGGAATPLPSGMSGPSGGGGQMATFLQGIMPLKMAQMQNATSLQIAAMNNETSKQVAGVKPQKGSMQEAQIAATKASEMLTYDQSAATQAQTTLTRNTVFLNMLRLALDALPSTEVYGVPGIRMTGKTGTYPLLQQLKQAPTGVKEDNELFGRMVGQIITNRAQQLKSELDALAKVGGDTVSDVTDFLGGLFKK